MGVEGSVYLSASGCLGSWLQTSSKREWLDGPLLHPRTPSGAANHTETPSAFWHTLPDQCNGMRLLQCAWRGLRPAP